MTNPIPPLPTHARVSTLPLQTLEGHEVTMSAEDHAKLAGWPGIDLRRLHVVEDEVYAEVRGKPHYLTLDGMLEVLSPPLEVAKAGPTTNAQDATQEASGALSGLTKVCRCCQKEKPIERFKRQTGAPDGRMSTCSTCATKARKERKALREIAESLAAKGPGQPRPGGKLALFQATGRTGWSRGSERRQYA